MKNKPVVYKFESAIRRCPASTRRHSGVLIVNFQYISHLAPVFLLLTFNIKLPAG